LGLARSLQQSKRRSGWRIAGGKAETRGTAGLPVRSGQDNGTAFPAGPITALLKSDDLKVNRRLAFFIVTSVLMTLLKVLLSLFNGRAAFADDYD
jgi:hypothetical protein